MQITNQQLTSVLSLAVFASTDKATPILTYLQLQQVGTQLLVTGTDRYCAVKAQYELAQVDLATAEPTYLHYADAKQFLPIVKKLDKQGKATIGPNRIDLDNGMSIQLGLVNVTNSFPDVVRLFNIDYTEQSAPRHLSIRPDFIGKLSKVILPTMGKTDPNAPWRFTFGQRDSGKPQPVLCEPVTRDNGTVTVLIQPNVLTS